MNPARAPHGPVILLTGATTGIGFATARRLMKSMPRAHLVLTARASSLPRFADGGVEEDSRIWIRPLDVTSAHDREVLVAEIEEKLGGVDVLINNAGITYRSVVEHVTEAERVRQMGVNFRGPMKLVRLVLPGMRRKRAGRIINISSVGGMMAMPTMAVYSASKFALEGASEALYYEVKPWNIHVSLLQLGFINSDAFEKVPYTGLSQKAAEDPENPYHRHYFHMSRFIGKIMRAAFATPEKAARRIECIMRKKRPVLRYRGTLDAHLFYLLRKLTPQRFYLFLLYRTLPGVSSWGKPTRRNTDSKASGSA